MVARRCGTRYEFILRVILVLVYLCAAASCRMERERESRETRDETRERACMLCGGMWSRNPAVARRRSKRRVSDRTQGERCNVLESPPSTAP